MLDHKRLRAVIGRCSALKSLAESQPGGSIAVFNLADQISELADILGSLDNPAGPEKVCNSSPENQRQLNLGDLADMLEAWPKKGDACMFDFGFTVPTKPMSYRGYYGHLALGFKECESYPEPTVETVLGWLRDAVGKAFTGYKGGEYEMSRSTPLWVANYGSTGSTAVVGRVESADHAFIIRTAYID